MTNRLIAWLDKPRCPWRAPLTDEQCDKRVGHRGKCATTDKFRQMHLWFGINYRDDGRYERVRLI